MTEEEYYNISNNNIEDNEDYNNDLNETDFDGDGYD